MSPGYKAFIEDFPRRLRYHGNLQSDIYIFIGEPEPNHTTFGKPFITFSENNSGTDDCLLRYIVNTEEAETLRELFDGSWYPINGLLIQKLIEIHNI